jgi:hypothetical protein
MSLAFIVMQLGQVAGMFWRQPVPPEVLDDALVLAEVLLAVLLEVLDVVLVLDEVVALVLDAAVVVVLDVVVVVVLDTVVVDVLLAEGPPPKPVTVPPPLLDAGPETAEPPVWSRTGSTPSAQCVSSTTNTPERARTGARLRCQCA